MPRWVLIVRRPHAQGDGSGELDHDVLAEIDEGFDRSHVRDPTPRGWADMAAVLRAHGHGMEGRAAPAP